MSTVKLNVEAGIAYVTINREEVRNSLDYPTLKQLEDVVHDIHFHPEVQIVIFTGAGKRAFSAGADLKERKTLTMSEVRRNVKTIRDVFSSIANLPQPTIAAVNGVAFGGGFELMLACDFSVAVKGAMMGLTETSWGIIPGAGGTQRLPRLIGEMKAKELILTAKKLTAEEAKALGIVLDVVEQHEVMDRAKQLAMAILRNAPIAVRQAKFAIN